MTHQVAASLAAGADAHIAKPIEAALLLRTISDFCARAEPASPGLRGRDDALTG